MKRFLTNALLVAAVIWVGLLILVIIEIAAKVL